MCSSSSACPPPCDRRRSAPISSLCIPWHPSATPLQPLCNPSATLCTLGAPRYPFAPHQCIPVYPLCTPLHASAPPLQEDGSRQRFEAMFQAGDLDLNIARPRPKSFSLMRSLSPQPNLNANSRLSRQPHSHIRLHPRPHPHSHPHHHPRPNPHGPKLKSNQLDVSTSSRR